MALYVQFRQLITKLRSELGLTDDVNVGVDDLPRLRRALRSAYNKVHPLHRWPHLHKVWERVTISPGQRYYDFPTNLNYDGVTDVVTWWSDLPTPVERGITFEDYAAFSSADDVRIDPIQKWDVRQDENNPAANVFEVWPLPAVAGEIQFTGWSKPLALTNDTDTVDLDDELVVLFAAAKLLPVKDGERNDKKAEAINYLNVLKARTQAQSTRVIVGGGDAPIRGTRPIIRVS